MKQKHYVTFYSPGTFFDEDTRVEIDSWNVDAAVAMSKDITERYGAKPYGFQFITRQLNDEDFEPSVSDNSCMYYLGGRVMTIEEVKSEMPDQSILIGNMECNGWGKVIVNTNSYRIIKPWRDDDVLLVSNDTESSDQEPATVTATETASCVCGHDKSYHDSDGYCDVTGCVCVRFRPTSVRE